MSMVGQPAPDVTLYDTAKKPVRFADYRGKKLVVAFYPAAFSGVCERELCTFRDAIAQFEALDAQVVGVSVDSPAANGAFAARSGVSFPLLCDYTRAAVQAFGVAHPDFWGMPGYTVAKRSVFVIDADGRVTWEWVAPNPGVEPDYDAVKAAVG